MNAIAEWEILDALDKGARAARDAGAGEIMVHVDEWRLHAAKRGTEGHPCGGCGTTTADNTLSARGWYRCNNCGYPSQ